MHVASNSTQVTWTFLHPTPPHPFTQVTWTLLHPTPPLPPSGTPAPKGIYIYIANKASYECCSLCISVPFAAKTRHLCRHRGCSFTATQAQHSLHCIFRKWIAQELCKQQWQPSHLEKLCKNGQSPMLRTNRACRSLSNVQSMASLLDRFNATHGTRPKWNRVSSRTMRPSEASPRRTPAKHRSRAVAKPAYEPAKATSTSVFREGESLRSLQLIWNSIVTLSAIKWPRRLSSLRSQPWNGPSPSNSAQAWRWDEVTTTNLGAILFSCLPSSKTLDNEHQQQPSTHWNNTIWVKACHSYTQHGAVGDLFHGFVQKCVTAFAVQRPHCCGNDVAKRGGRCERSSNKNAPASRSCSTSTLVIITEHHMTIRILKKSCRKKV